MVEIIAYIGIFVIGLMCGIAIMDWSREKRRQLMSEFMLTCSHRENAEQRMLELEFREWCRNRHPFLHSFVA